MMLTGTERDITRRDRADPSVSHHWTPRATFCAKAVNKKPRLEFRYKKPLARGRIDRKCDRGPRKTFPEEIVVVQRCRVIFLRYLPKVGR